MSSRRTKDIPNRKKEALANLINTINKNNTIMVVSIENISAPQFQKIKRSLKDKATVKVIKKTLMLRALEEVKKTKKNIEKLEPWLQKGFAVMFSNIDPFELSQTISFLRRQKLGKQPHKI